MTKIIITEDKFRRLILEGDSRLKKVEQIMRQAFNGKLDLDSTVSSRDYFVNGNENTRWKDYLLFNLRHTFGLMSNSDVKYLPIVAQLAWSNDVGFDLRDGNGEEVQKLLKFVSIFKQDETIFNKIKSLPNISFRTVSEMLNPIIQQQESEANQRMSSTDYGGLNQNYKIIVVNSFEDAKPIGKYSSTNLPLCFTTGINQWKSFTNNGKNKVYCLLLKGYKSVKEKHTDSIYDFLPWNAYDEYGLSMIWLFVNPQGDLVYSNTRWNHDADYGKMSVDHAFSKEDISKIIGQSFDSIFKGYTDEELEEKGILNVTFENCEEYIKKGYKLNQIFDGVEECKNGFFMVELCDKEDFITPKGTLLSKTPFDWVDDFYNGFACVELNGGYYFINEYGTFLNQKPFVCASSFREGFAIVEVVVGEWNFMKMDGSLLCKENFAYIENFSNGLALVKIRYGEWNFMKTDGSLLCKENFAYIKPFVNGFARVEVANGEYNFLKMDGSLLCKENFSFIDDFTNGFAIVVNFNGKENYIDKHGNLLLNEWFDKCENFYKKIAFVEKNGLWNIISRNGKIVSDIWFKDKLAMADKDDGICAKLIDTNNNIFILYNDLMVNTETNEKTQLQLESRTNFIKKIIREELNKYIR